MSRLIWNKTGDFIDLAVVNCEVYEYFVENLTKHGINQYSMGNLNFDQLRDELIEKHTLFRDFVRNRLKSNTLDFDIDPSNHDDLNKLHRAWVKLHQQYPNIGRVFDSSVLLRINKLIHQIEELSHNVVINTSKPHLCFENIFGSKILSHGVWNLGIEFNNLGRTSFNKWHNGDSIADTDTNNFDEIYTQLRIKVIPAREYQLPVSYQNWCNQHGLECVGDCLPLANFDNIEQNLLKYKQLVLTNSLIKNNFIILE